MAEPTKRSGDAEGSGDAEVSGDAAPKKRLVYKISEAER